VCWRPRGEGPLYRSREWGAQAPPVVVVASKTTPLMGRGDGGAQISRLAQDDREGEEDLLVHAGLFPVLGLVYNRMREMNREGNER
jgi:hypothetical protein